MTDHLAVVRDSVQIVIGSARRTLGIFKFLTRDGHRTWMALEWPSYVQTCLVLGLTPEGKIVLIENYRFPIERRVLELPGGDPQSPDDKLEEVALREFREETGYEPRGTLELLTQGWLQTAMSNAPFIVFLARDCVRVGQQNLDPIEEATGMTVVEMTPDELIAQIGQDPLSVCTHGLDRGLLKLQLMGIIPPIILFPSY